MRKTPYANCFRLPGLAKCSINARGTACPGRDFLHTLENSVGVHHAGIDVERAGNPSSRAASLTRRCLLTANTTAASPLCANSMRFQTASRLQKPSTPDRPSDRFPVHELHIGHALADAREIENRVAGAGRQGPAGQRDRQAVRRLHREIGRPQSRDEALHSVGEWPGSGPRRHSAGTPFRPQRSSASIVKRSQAISAGKARAS